MRGWAQSIRFDYPVAERRVLSGDKYLPTCSEQSSLQSIRLRALHTELPCSRVWPLAFGPTSTPRARKRSQSAIAFHQTRRTSKLINESTSTIAISIQH